MKNKKKQIFKPINFLSIDEMAKNFGADDSCYCDVVLSYGACDCATNADVCDEICRYRPMFCETRIQYH